MIVKRRNRLSFFLFCLCIGTVLYMKGPIPVTAEDFQISAEFTNEVPKQFVPVTLNITGSDDLTDVRFAYKHVAKPIYFSKYPQNGTVIKKNSNGKYTFQVNQVGYVSVYAKNKNGQEDLITFFISKMDTLSPTLEISERDIGGYFIVDLEARDDQTENVSIRYLSGAYASPSDPIWEQGEELINTGKLFLREGKYSFLVKDRAGNTYLTIRRFGKPRVEEEEFRATWISYLDFSTKGYTEQTFRQHIETMFNECVAMNLNAVVVHVRPFGDAFYPSKYFPWSVYVSGKQGTNPGFDPLKIMIEEAHSRGLAFHAWLNPYRISNNSTDVLTLSTDNPARKFRTDSSTLNDRNVLAYSGKLYYNPASKEVQQLIVNGIKEIVTNYDVDGIHFDDYFYPSLGKNYTTNFDSKEYETYKASLSNMNQEPLSIDNWRRQNVNTLVKTIYSSIKKINADVIYGISPGGFLDSLRANDKYYVDVDTWLGYDGYIDYLCPQLYWSNDHATYPFDEILNRFAKLKVNPDVKLFVGVGVYKAGIKTEGTDWYMNPNVLRDMIRSGRDNDKVDGFILYGYTHLISKRNYTSVKNMLKEIK